MGSFETDIDVPDLKIQPLKMSSVVLASRIQAVKKNTNLNPLVRDGNEIVPNITHVFSATSISFFTMRSMIRRGQRSASRRAAAQKIELASGCCPTSRSFKVRPKPTRVLWSS